MHKTHATHVVAKRSGSRVIVLTKKYGQQNKTKKNKKNSATALKTMLPRTVIKPEAEEKKIHR